MDVGVRELKQHLSKYLDRAERGELIRVTDRGRPKAILTALPGRGQIDKGIEEGWITPATELGPLPPATRHRSRRSVNEVLGEDRER